MLAPPAQPPPPPQQQHPQQQQSLYELLLAAAVQPAGAAAGLTPELAASFIILLPLQADQVRLLALMVRTCSLMMSCC
jgi:hypothetical protein